MKMNFIAPTSFFFNYTSYEDGTQINRSVFRDCAIMDIGSGGIVVEFPKRFNTIESHLEFIRSDGIEKIKRARYIFTFGEENKQIDFAIEKTIDDIESEYFTIDWENSSDSFHFGYRLVRFVDGTFGYVKKGNGEEICPFKFDIASEFNEYGLAMIGKNGCVNWIDHNFEYLSMSGNKISCKNVLRENILRGGEWEFLSDFPNGSDPLSTMFTSRFHKEGRVVYLKSDGSIQVFRRFDGNILGEQQCVFGPVNFARRELSFRDIGFIRFGPEGYKVLQDRILFAKGYYSTLEDALQIASKSGVNVLNDTQAFIKKLNLESQK